MKPQLSTTTITFALALGLFLLTPTNAQPRSNRGRGQRGGRGGGGFRGGNRGGPKGNNRPGPPRGNDFGFGFGFDLDDPTLPPFEGTLCSDLPDANNPDISCTVERPGRNGATVTIEGFYVCHSIMRRNGQEDIRTMCVPDDFLEVVQSLGGTCGWCGMDSDPMEDAPMGCPVEDAGTGPCTEADEVPMCFIGRRGGSRDRCVPLEYSLFGVLRGGECGMCLE